MSNCLVTGGAGFIGSHIVDRLIKEGHEVIVLDDLSTGFERNLNSKAVFINGSVTNDRIICETFTENKIDYVFHLAAQIDVRKSTENPVYDANINIIGALNLIRIAEENKIKKFIYVSTGGAVYGEPEYTPADEAHPVNPLCPYGISKHVVEHYLYYYAWEKGLNYTVLRLPNVYGPRQNPEGEAGVVAIFINALIAGKVPVLFGFGKATRDYVYVGDVVNAVISAIDKGDGEIINLGWGKEVSVQDIYDTICNELNVDVKPKYEELRAGEIKAISLNAEKAKKILGWAPVVSLQEGIHHTVNWISGK
ncbi:MAG: NAD-dependent epimerase/dehydratase family protein [Candidatus Margulisiibacteriota bacterium]